MKNTATQGTDIQGCFIVLLSLLFVYLISTREMIGGILHEGRATWE